MRVIQVSQFGGPEVLVPTEAPDPVAGAGQAVVGVSVADILFVETQIRSGWGAEYFHMKPPYVPGFGVGGQVLAVGEGVDPGWIGRRVIADTGRRGGYAEKAVVAAEALIAVPQGLGLPEAAALMHDGTTAMALAHAARIQPHQWVLVVAAAGGLGALLVQLAHQAGARVIGAARGKRKLSLVRELGADAVVDYSEPDWVEQVRKATGGHGADVVFDGAGGQLGRAAFEVAARGAWFSAHGAPSGGFARIDPKEAEQRGVTLRGIQDVQMKGAEKQRWVEKALSEAAAGRLRPIIGQSFPLERAADAHAALEARQVLGKALLVIE
ncbi:zinc-binding dehydrogenase [Hyalangium versicolor]|uniref:zinc-binding dehydrogenase n=1 Tax=Hyalangium versicolor TaxID=2861190 RepID=UPI001CCEC229|nr:zinc-binding dehydrogenase [Hyalangium versicolor]